MSILYTKVFWVSFVLVILAFLLGLTVGRTNLKPTANRDANKPVSAYPADVFSMQSAVLKGRVIKTDGSTLTVMTPKQVQATFPLAQRVYITKYDSLGKPSVSNSPKDIELNKDVTINLEYVAASNKYFVLTITYIPPFPGQKTATSTPKL
ncbi:hypothetical protein HYW46_04465 [Candidatus Daviesbacteria bacterium]|nr:hypothetical protein [Candidatus Daviesbacteria bacterium]